MDWDEALDIAEEFTLTLTGEQRIEAFRRQAGSMPVGEVGRAAFLNEMAEYLAMGGRLGEARQAHLDAIADGGPTTLDPRAGLLDIALKTGDSDAAARLLAELMALSRAGTLGTDSHECVGELLEMQDRLKEAHQRFTMPIRDLDPDDLDLLPIGCLNGRYRVRRVLELPVDRYDDTTLELQAIHRARVALQD